MSSARIRMYRQGIGDCFLVQLPRDNGQDPFRMVIDCGVVLGTPGAKALMENVVDSLQRATGGDPDADQPGIIDLLVITHEHWDHVSAFNQVDWKTRFNVRAVWAAWTENPDDEQAQSLDKAKKMALSALAAVSLRLGQDGAGQASTINEMLGFFGMGPLADPDALGARATTRGGRDKALALAGPNIAFLEPGGAPIPLDGVQNARVFVLGPPRNKKLLKKADPSTAEPETYGFGDGDDAMFRLSVLADALENEGSGPFSPTFEIPVADAKTMTFFRQHYFAAVTRVEAGKDAEIDTLLRDESWRRIDHDWAGPAAELAMKLDKATNNTSLAFAIELEPGGDVLLFPADAQVGNWLSWHGVEWTGEGAGVTAQDLLERTRLYKVGHHGSHNATLKEKGLELMRNPNLVAMIPVNHEVAVKKGWHEMPLDELIDRLKDADKTKGRILRSDDENFPNKPAGVNANTWRAFLKDVTIPPAGDPEEGLYFELEI